MTLIAAFRTDTGVVICADSQETYGDYRVEVDKLDKRDAGGYDLIVGGAGNTAALIDGLSRAIEGNVQRWPSGLSGDEAEARLSTILLAYHSRQIALYPAEPDEKRLRFIICARDKDSKQIHLWKTDGTTIEPVTTYALMGWEDAAYHYEVEWLYYPRLWTVQAILLGIHLFTVASNSQYIGGDTQVIVINPEGVRVESPADVHVLEERIRGFNEKLARLILACPDGTINHASFMEMLAVFEDEIVRMRMNYLGQTGAAALLPGVHPIMPLGSVIESLRDEPQESEEE